MEITSKDSLLVDLNPLYSILEDINISWKQSPSQIYQNIRNYLKEESSKNSGNLQIIVLYLILVYTSTITIQNTFSHMIF